MINAFRAEWVRLVRVRALLAVALPLAILPALITVLTFAAATGDPGAGPGQHLDVGIAELSAPDGFLVGLEKTATLIGVIVMVFFAASFGADQAHGTLRNLLIREPRRIHLLTGKLLALLAFTAAGLVLAVGTATATAWAAAPGYDVSTAAWTGRPVFESTTAWAALVVAAIGWATAGTLVATVLRSVSAAVAIGVVWALPVESILTTVWVGGNRWLPGSAFTALAEQGTDALSLTAAAALVVLYSAIAYVAAAGSLRSRDVLS